MWYVISFVKHTFIFSALLVLQLPNTFFIIKIFLLLYSFPYLVIAFFKSRFYHKSLLIIAIQDFGIGMIKLGQFLATRSDIVGEKTAKILQDLHENLSPCRRSKIIKNAPNIIIKDVIATASIAQVHMGLLNDSTVVAVKMIKPGIAEQIEIQTNTMYLFTRIICFFSRKIKKLDILTIVTEISRYLKMETNLQMEAAAIDSFKQRFAGDSNIYVPKVYWQFVTENCLVIEWIDGFTLNKYNELNKLSPLLRRKIANDLLIFFLKQIYEDGIFQADPHQGNFIITKDYKIAVVDFGRVGFLNKRERSFVTQILHGFLTKDYKKVAEIHMQAGYVPKNIDIFLFEMSCRVIGEKIIGKNLDQIKVGEVFGHVLNMALQFEMKTQKSLVLFQKTIVMLEGLLFYIDPKFNAWETAKPWMEEYIKKEYSYKNIFLENFETIKDKILSCIL